MGSSLFTQKRQLLHRRMRRTVRAFLTEYETPKIVAIHSLSFTLLLRAMQIIILIYSIIYLLIYEQGYQKSDTAIISSVTLKVKGVGYIHTGDNEKMVIDVAGKSLRLDRTTDRIELRRLHRSTIGEQRNLHHDEFYPYRSESISLCGKSQFERSSMRERFRLSESIVHSQCEWSMDGPMSTRSFDDQYNEETDWPLRNGR